MQVHMINSQESGTSMDKLVRSFMASLWLSYNPNPFNRCFTIRLEGKHFEGRIVAFDKNVHTTEQNRNIHFYNQLLETKQFEKFVFMKFTDENGMEIPSRQIGLSTPEGGSFFTFIAHRMDRITFQLTDDFKDE